MPASSCQSARTPDLAACGSAQAVDDVTGYRPNMTRASVFGIDKFEVPERSLEEFLGRVRRTQMTSTRRTLPHSGRVATSCIRLRTSRGECDASLCAIQTERCSTS